MRRKSPVAGEERPGLRMLREMLLLLLPGAGLNLPFMTSNGVSSWQLRYTLVAGNSLDGPPLPAAFLGEVGAPIGAGDFNRSGAGFCSSRRELSFCLPAR